MKHILERLMAWFVGLQFMAYEFMFVKKRRPEDPEAWCVADNLTDEERAARRKAMDEPILETFRSDAFVQLLRHSSRCVSQNCRNKIHDVVSCANPYTSSTRDDFTPAFCDIAQPIHDRWLALEQTNSLEKALEINHPPGSVSTMAMFPTSRHV